MRTLATALTVLLLASAVHAQFDLPEKQDTQKPAPAKEEPPASPVDVAPEPATPPAGLPGMEPAAQAQPAEPAPEPKAQPAVTRAQKTVAGVVARQIKKLADPEGINHVRDRKLKKDWDLKLERVAPEKVLLTDETHAVATADFKSVDGEHTLEVDYVMEKTGRVWRRKKVGIRSVDGQPRGLGQATP